MAPPGQIKTAPSSVHTHAHTCAHTPLLSSLLPLLTSLELTKITAAHRLLI